MKIAIVQHNTLFSATVTLIEPAFSEMWWRSITATDSRRRVRKAGEVTPIETKRPMQRLINLTRQAFSSAQPFAVQ